MSARSFKTEYSRVVGLGSAREGTGHWWQQRLTAIALVPLTPVFVFLFGSSLGATRDEALATFSSPLAAVATMLFLAVGFRHLQQGLQVVIEDYVHGKRMATVALVLNTLLCWGLAATGIFMVARIAFGFAG